MHKDQKRVQEAFLPTLMDRVLDETPEAERDCTVVNRLFLQGPDPLFIMEANPKGFEALCEKLLLDPKAGRVAIEMAHWQGPAVLMNENEDGTWGLQPWQEEELDIVDLSETERGEALWLLLASCSDCTEEEYSETITLLERIQRATRAAVRLSDLVSEAETNAEDVMNFDPIWWSIFHTLSEFEQNTEFLFDDRGIPHATEDHAFYIAYKNGHKVCAVHTHGPTFYGTVPTTSLEEQGIEVGKVISPQFGLILVEDSRGDFETLRPTP